MKPRISSEILLWFGLLLFGISGFFLTVLFRQPEGFYVFVAVSALAGLGVSAYIFYSKARDKQLVCAPGGDCDAVVTSRYANFFGIPLERLGILYFGVILFAYSVLLLAPQFFGGNARAALTLLSATASLFSGYLLFVQAFLLKKWCIWCILAAMFSLTIFLFALVSASGAIAFLARLEPLLMMLKFLGFALGMGGATTVLFLFARFLRDLDIDEKELSVLKDISELVWVGLGLVVMSQFALYVASPAGFAESGLFFAEMVALFGAAFSGAVFMIMYAPFLAYVPFDKKDKQDASSGFAALRRPTLVIGALALSSWYVAFIMNFIPEYTFAGLLGVYAAVLVGAVALSMLWELQYRKKRASQ